MKNTKKKRNATNSAEAQHLPLPAEIMLDILSRLGVREELCQCMLVCKAWYGFIKDPLFVDLHLSRPHHPTFLIMYSLGANSLFLVDVDTKNNIKSAILNASKPLPLSSDYFPEDRVTPTLVGSSHGLLCLRSRTDVRSHYILNPITGETVRLPIAPPSDPPFKRRSRLRTRLPFGSFSAYYRAPSAFALDATTKTYKLIQPWCFHIDGVKLQKAVFNMHTLGSSPTWTRVHEMFAMFSRDNRHAPPVFLNNTFHWPMFIGTESDYFIGAIHLGGPTFKTLKPPPSHRNNTMYTCLSSLNGCLSLIYKTHDSRVLVWAMNDYGVDSTWSFKYSITLSVVMPPFSRVSPHWMAPTTPISMKNGNILAVDGKCLLWCNFEKNEHQVLKVPGLPPAFNCRYTTVVAHISSLISPQRIAANAQINVRSRRNVVRPLRYTK